MKVFIQSPDASLRIDGTVQKFLLDFFPERVAAQEQADVVLVPISLFADYQFNDKLDRIHKPWVMIDYLEYEWCASAEPDTHLLGQNTRSCKWLQSPDWFKLCDWSAAHPPLAYFKRELRAKDRTETVLPVEFPCFNPAPPLQSRQEFDDRPLEVFFSWGYSHPARANLHADIFRGMATHGLEIISEWDQRPPDGSRGTWASIYSPWYARKPIETVLEWQQKAKLSVSLPGAGVKCFRSSESPVGSIMALQMDNLAWSFPWNDNENCIRLLPKDEFRELQFAANRRDLYEIYLASQENIDRYRSARYVSEYILPSIGRLI